MRKFWKYQNLLSMLKKFKVVQKRSTLSKSEKLVFWVFFLKFDTFPRPVLESVKADAQVWRNYGNATKKFINKRYTYPSIQHISFQLGFEFKVFHLWKQFRNYSSKVDTTFLLKCVKTSLHFWHKKLSMTILPKNHA